MAIGRVVMRKASLAFPLRISNLGDLFGFD